MSPSVASCHIDRTCMIQSCFVVSVWITLFISADSEEWKLWAKDLWLYTSWTPEELDKTLRGRRNYQAGHLAARAKARLMDLSAARRILQHPVALIRTCHCARVTHPFVCVHMHACMYIYTAVESDCTQAVEEGTGTPPPQPSPARAAAAPPVRLVCT